MHNASRYTELIGCYGDVLFVGLPLVQRIHLSSDDEKC